jgi:endonuclease-8
MPEGDTIHRSAHNIGLWLAGRTVTAISSHQLGRRAQALVGSEVQSVRALGKHLLIDFSNGLSLRTHMRMTGSWHLYSQGETWRKPRSYARVIIACQERLAVCFSAPVVELVSGSRLDSPVAIGPDLLGHPAVLDWPGLERRAARSRADTVGELLLDQSVMAGIGNIYRCETLFLAGINPLTPWRQLGLSAVQATFDRAGQLLRANANAPTHRRNFGLGPGAYFVYGRAGRPCRRCRSLVQSEYLGHELPRRVFFCPLCQPGSDRPAD